MEFQKIIKDSMEMTEEVLENIKQNFNHITDDNNEPLHLRSSFKSLFAYFLIDYFI